MKIIFLPLARSSNHMNGTDTSILQRPFNEGRKNWLSVEYVVVFTNILKRSVRCPSFASFIFDCYLVCERSSHVDEPVIKKGMGVRKQQMFPTSPGSGSGNEFTPSCSYMHLLTYSNRNSSSSDLGHQDGPH